MSVESPVVAYLGRSWIGLLAIVALSLQTLAPAMAHAASGQSGNWIEICADNGPVLIQIDEEGLVQTKAPAVPEHGACPKCLTCVICAGVTGLDGYAAPQLVFALFEQTLAAHVAEGVVFVRTAWERPMTRGPPCAPQKKNEMARAGHVMAVTLKTGGAL